MQIKCLSEVIDKTLCLNLGLIEFNESKNLKDILVDTQNMLESFCDGLNFRVSVINFLC